MGLIKCPECGGTMQKIYGTKHETYYECIECGYGELMEKSEYEPDEFIEDEEFDEDYEYYDLEENDLENIEDEGLDY